MLILKSASPRRIQIFQDLGLDFQIKPSSIDESISVGENFQDYLKRITIAKLELPDGSYSDVYVASDTIVVKSEKIYLKPLDFETAISTLSELNGKTHFVYSSMCISRNHRLFYDFDMTKIELKNWSVAEIENYVKSCNPLDKAGSYGVQDNYGPVKKIEGSYTNVLGFPIRAFFKYFSEWKEFLNHD